MDRMKLLKRILAGILLALMVIPTFTTVLMWIMGVI